MPLTEAVRKETLRAATVYLEGSQRTEDSMRSLLAIGTAATAVAAATFVAPAPAQAWYRHYGYAYRPYAYAYVYRPYTYTYAYRPYYSYAYAYRPYYSYANAYRPYYAYAYAGYGRRHWIGWRWR